jgi:K+-transporting ATPase ATPase C chain
MNMLASLRAALGMVLLMTLLLGGAYPLLVTGIAQAVFHHKANGSLIVRGDRLIGSQLLGQNFEHPKYFWGRLSATVPPYNAASSDASNLSPANPMLLEAANARIAALQQADPRNQARIPVDLVTASASGLDPHISVAAAEYQASRVAHARHMPEDKVKAMIADFTENSLFGEAGVNVLRLNLALDEALGSGPQVPGKTK